LEALAHLGRLDLLTVSDAVGEQRPIGMVRSDAGTAYLTTDGWVDTDLPLDPATATSRGVGEAIGEAVANGARRLVVAAGDVPWHDAGVGLLEGLAARLGLAPGAPPAGSDTRAP